MIYGIGCDLCDTARMAKSLGGPHGSTFAARVFGPAEREALGLSEGNFSPLSAHKAASAAADFAAKGLRPDVICVDPPRKGLSPEVVAAAASMAPQRIVYVSCDPATLARDVKLFAQEGYAAVRAVAVDMFPGTANVETVARLERCV